MNRSVFRGICFCLMLLPLGGCVMVNRPAKPSIEALDHHLPQAMAGNVQSSYQTGLAFSSGWYAQGLRNDPDAALRYLTDAAEQGSGPAQNLLGRYYREGFPNTGPNAGRSKPDLNLAAYWLHRAAEQGQKESFSQLTLLYETAAYSQASPVEACKWALINYPGGPYCTNKKLPADQIKAAQREATLWRQKHLLTGTAP